MRCYNCGMELSENDFCTACGADVSFYKKIIRLSNHYYNEGLQKAQVRDLSGAAECLRQSLKCYKYNTDARNLLGLIYFEIGEAVDAISEWVISKNFQPKKNIADDFLDSIQNNPSKWDNIRQTIKKYNQALDYCRQDSLDLAIIQLKSLLKTNPKIIKGHQLLALLYMNMEHWEKAQRCIARARKIDTNNTTTLQYAKEIEDAIRLKDELDPEGASRRKKKQKNPQKDVIAYTSGNETIIQPINSFDNSSGGLNALYVVAGLLVGLAVMWFLVMPAKLRSVQKEAHDSVVEISNQLTEKSANIEELQKRLSALEAENEELMQEMEAYTGADGVLTAADNLMNAARQYMRNPDDAMAASEMLELIDGEYALSDESSEAFTDLYKYLASEIGESASGEYLSKGLDSIEAGNFNAAIENLTKAYALDNSNVEALYNLGNAYRRAGEKGRALEAYNQVISLFPDCDYIEDAKEHAQTLTDEGEEANEASNAGDDSQNHDNDVVSEVTTQMPTESVN